MENMIEYGGFLEWGYPQVAGCFRENTIYQWMIKWGTPMTSWKPQYQNVNTARCKRVILFLGWCMTSMMIKWYVDTIRCPKFAYFFGGWYMNIMINQGHPQTSHRHQHISGRSHQTSSNIRAINYQWSSIEIRITYQNIPDKHQCGSLNTK